jgi:hypothetical protein
LIAARLPPDSRASKEVLRFVPALAVNAVLLIEPIADAPPPRITVGLTANAGNVPEIPKLVLLMLPPAILKEGVDANGGSVPLIPKAVFPIFPPPRLNVGVKANAGSDPVSDTDPDTGCGVVPVGSIRTGFVKDPSVFDPS